MHTLETHLTKKATHMPKFKIERLEDRIVPGALCLGYGNDDDNDSSGSGNDSSGSGKDKSGSGKDNSGSGKCKDNSGSGKDKSGSGKDKSGSGKGKNCKPAPAPAPCKPPVVIKGRRC